MVVPNDGYGGGFGMRSSSSSISAFNHMNAKAAEAELISKATQTAIVAARSILMSGGTEEVALKTAKAAAESVLNPQASDNDTVSGRSTVGSVFGGRKRKAKRQAEVVASMALMSASSGIRQTGSSMDMSEWNGSSSHPPHPYGRNIITFRQDEPSVLSGSISTRPPRIPTPTSHKSGPSNSASAPKMSHSSSTAGLVMQTSATMSGISPRKSSRPAVDTSGMFFPSQPPNASPALAAGNAKESPAEPESTKSSSKDKSKDENTNTSNFLDKILNISSTPKNTPDKEKTSTPTPKPLTPKLFEMESDSVSQSGTMDSELQSSVESSLDEYSAAETATPDSPRHSRKNGTDKESASTYSFDPLLVNVTKALNIFTCGPLGAFSGGQATDDLEELEAMEGIRGSRRDRHVVGRDGTFDDNSTNYSGDDTNTDMTGRDARDDVSHFRDPDFGLIASKSSDSSNELLRDLMSSEHSEGAIQVRSSIRETMEKIVSKSKKGHRRGNSRGNSRRGRRSDSVDKKWLSYELSQQKDDEHEIPVLSSKKKSKRGSSISRRTRTPTKKGGSSKSLGKKQSFFFKNKNKGS